MDFSHIPVLLNETIELLSVKPSGVYLDGTAGGGGHSYEIAKRLTEGGKLFSTDRDGEAVRAASQNAAESAGLESRKGSLLPGKDADIVIMDRDCNVRQTYVRGVCKFDARSLR